MHFLSLGRLQGAWRMGGVGEEGKHGERKLGEKVEGRTPLSTPALATCQDGAGRTTGLFESPARPWWGALLFLLGSGSHQVFIRCAEAHRACPTLAFGWMGRSPERGQEQMHCSLQARVLSWPDSRRCCLRFQLGLGRACPKWGGAVQRNSIQSKQQ